jgi:putative methionine-R-sulfoxide reductase with GAF domain
LPPSRRDALQALLAFSAMHQQVRRRRALALRHSGFETLPRPHEFETGEQFVLDEVLQLVAERAIAITGADGLGIALAQNNEIVLRASAGVIKPDVGARIQRDSAFSGACFRTAQIIRCDDTETDDRVNLYACRQLGARSMVAVPLCGRRRVIGLLEAFSSEPFGFNDSDVASLEMLAELILGALKPEDEDRFAESAQVAEAKLAAPAIATPLAPPIAEAPPIKPFAEPPAQVEEKAKAAVVHSEAAIVEPVTATVLAPQLRVEQKSAAAKSVTEETFLSETTEPEPLAGRHPGIVLVLVLLVVSAVLAGGLWWKLKNDQLGDMMVRPEPKITKHAAVAKQPVIPSSILSSSASPEGKAISAANAGTAADHDTTQSGSESATPQEATTMPRITGIRHWSADDSSTVVLDLEDPVQYEA